MDERLKELYESPEPNLFASKIPINNVKLENRARSEEIDAFLRACDSDHRCHYHTLPQGISPLNFEELLYGAHLFFAGQSAECLITAAGEGMVGDARLKGIYFRQGEIEVGLFSEEYKKWSLHFLNGNPANQIIELHNHPYPYDRDMPKFEQTVMDVLSGRLPDVDLLQLIMTPGPIPHDRMIGGIFWKTDGRFQSFVWGNGMYRAILLPRIIPKADG